MRPHVDSLTLSNDCFKEDTHRASFVVTENSGKKIALKSKVMCFNAHCQILRRNKQQQMEELLHILEIAW